MHHIIVTGAKGGVGATTIAAAIAVGLTRDGEAVSLVGRDRFIFAHLGLPTATDDEPRECEALPGLRVSFGRIPDAMAGTVVIDAGTDPAALSAALDTVGDDDTAMVYTVVRNDYLSLSAAMAGKTPDRFVLVNEPGRSLSADDVTNVLGDLAAVVPFSPAIGRTIDAGLLLSRLPRDLVGLTDAAAVLV